MKKQQQVKISRSLAKSISSALLEYQIALQKHNLHYGVRGYRELLEQSIYESDKKARPINNNGFKLSL